MIIQCPRVNYAEAMLPPTYLEVVKKWLNSRGAPKEEGPKSMDGRRGWAEATFLSITFRQSRKELIYANIYSYYTYFINNCTCCLKEFAWESVYIKELFN